MGICSLHQFCKTHLGNYFRKKLVAAEIKSKFENELPSVGSLPLWISWKSSPFALALWRQRPLQSPESVATPPHQPLHHMNDTTCDTVDVLHGFERELTMTCPKSKSCLTIQGITSSPLFPPEMGSFIIRLGAISQLGSYSSAWILQQVFKGSELCTRVAEIMAILAHKEKINKWMFLLRIRDIYTLNNFWPK